MLQRCPNSMMELLLIALSLKIGVTLILILKIMVNTNRNRDKRKNKWRKTNKQEKEVINGINKLLKNKDKGKIKGMVAMLTLTVTVVWMRIYIKDKEHIQ